MVEKAAEVLAADVERRHRRHDRGAGQQQPAHVLDVDEVVGRLAETEHQRPSLLERHRPGAVDEGARGAGREGAEGAGAARQHGRAGETVRARGDGRVELAVAVAAQLGEGGSVQAGRRGQIGGAGALRSQLVPQHLARAG